QPNVNDDLSNNTHNWQGGMGTSHGTCNFTQGALHIAQEVNGNVTVCTSQITHGDTFAVEVSEDLDAGFGGGIAYHAGSAMYRFTVPQNGTADLVSDSGPPDYETPTLLNHTVAGGAHIGPHQTIRIFMVAQHQHYSFWVNGEYVGDVEDSSPPASLG